MEDRTFIEQGRSRSWLDPVGAAEISSLCVSRLLCKAECIKERGNKLWFVTTTYDPHQWGIDDWASRSWPSADDAAELCWDAMTGDRHLHHFMKRLGERINYDFRGKWWSKREFHKSGFVHHHMLIEGPQYIDFRETRLAWGWGRVKVEGAKKGPIALCKYVGKYCTKYGDDAPDWIMAREAGTVRMTTSSEGWWSELDHAATAGDAVESLDRSGRRSTASAPVGEDKRYGCVESIGDRVRRLSRTVIVRRPGVRRDVQGVTLDEFRRNRDDRWYRGHVVKERRSMDAITGLPVSQAVRELEEIRRHLSGISGGEPVNGRDGCQVSGAVCERSGGGAAYSCPPHRNVKNGREVGCLFTHQRDGP